jgi:hypothetical protein
MFQDYSGPKNVNESLIMVFNASVWAIEVA